MNKPLKFSEQQINNMFSKKVFDLAYSPLSLFLTWNTKKLCVTGAKSQRPVHAHPRACTFVPILFSLGTHVSGAIKFPYMAEVANDGYFL